LKGIKKITFSKPKYLSPSSANKESFEDAPPFVFRIKKLD